MAEDQSPSGTTTEARGDGSSNTDTVAYDTYRKAVSEAKKAKEEAAVLRAEKEAAAQSVLTEQGKFKELNEKLQKDLKLKEDEAKKKDAFFIQQNLKQTVSRFAKELGAIDETAIDQIYVVASQGGYLSSVEVKEDYSVNGDQIKTALSELQKKSPWFFQKQVAAPKDINLGGNSGGTGPVDLSKLSMEQLAQLAKNAK